MALMQLNIFLTKLFTATLLLLLDERNSVNLSEGVGQRYLSSYGCPKLVKHQASKDTYIVVDVPKNHYAPEAKEEVCYQWNNPDYTRL